MASDLLAGVFGNERNAMEVAPVKLNYTIERPSTLPAAVCAPSVSLLPVSAPVAVVPASASVAMLPASAPVAVLAAERARASQAHQVQIQAELVRVLVAVDGSYGTTGFLGGNGTDLSMKRRVDGSSGVPPRGRPV